MRIQLDNRSVKKQCHCKDTYLLRLRSLQCIRNIMQMDKREPVSTWMHSAFIGQINQIEGKSSPSTESHSYFFSFRLTTVASNAHIAFAPMHVRYTVAKCRHRQHFLNLIGTYVENFNRKKRCAYAQSQWNCPYR